MLDLAVYAQHVAIHFVPALWRLHRVHHADTEFDVTTGVRFHPIEILLSQVWKIAVVLALGVPALAVLVFEIVLNATSMFSHANVRLPGRSTARLRLSDRDAGHAPRASFDVDARDELEFRLQSFALGSVVRHLSCRRRRPSTRRCRSDFAPIAGLEPRRLPWMLLFPFRRGARA